MALPPQRLAPRVAEPDIAAFDWWLIMTGNWMTIEDREGAP